MLEMRRSQRCYEADPVYPFSPVSLARGEEPVVLVAQSLGIVLVAAHKYLPIWDDALGKTRLVGSR